ncbi:MAG: hypothetical protein KGJ41_14325 [Rhodospirillales bacterium]|nr:hypothetical protein [Rhodospirillales bacterium]MDE2200189.1 hypothetical protein [Rhodospirillales bacterium]MDE2575655.1 hypothetical protein [Rhodospirillales bacterium]
MDQHAAAEAWQIDPITSTIRPCDAIRDPVVMVVEEMPALGVAIAEVCDFLRIRVEHVSSARELAQAMPHQRPIAVLSEARSIDCSVYDLLMAVASYDTALPVLLVINDQPSQRGALDAAQRLWQLTEVSRVGQRPGIRGLIDFLFLAGRKSGAERMLRA